MGRWASIAWRVGVVLAWSCCAHGQTVLYVNAAATTGANNGSSCANAFQGVMGVQNALAAAAPIAGGGTQVQIWTVQGTYKPTNGTDINISFNLLSNVALYGGFVGTETQLSQRAPATNVTTLSGVLSASPAINSRHIVRAVGGVNRSALLDGFTVTGGQCWMSPTTDRIGAGVLVSASSPTIRQCRVTGNTARFGGGVGNTLSGTPLVQDCYLSGRALAPGGGQMGGGVFSDSGHAEVVNCTISGAGTGALGDGGGVACTGGQVSITDTVITGCDAEAGGGLASFGAGAITLLRCEVINNRTGSGACAMGGSGYLARECSIRGNTMLSSGPYGGAILTGNGAFIGCEFVGNQAPFGALSVSSISHFINCSFRNNSGGRTGSPLFDNNAVFDQCVFVGNAPTGPMFGGGVIRNCVVYGNAGSAVALASAADELTNCIVWANGSGSEANQIQGTPGVGAVNYNTIQSWSGVLGGTGNNAGNPRFADPMGPDGIAASGDEDFRLISGSPCIDSANADALPLDTYDLDGDANTTEPLPLDYAGLERLVDDLPANTGVGFVPYLDRGAHEHIPSTGSSSLWNNPAGGSYTTASNWLPGVPGAVDEVLFDSGGGYTVQLSGAVTAKRMLIRSGQVIFNPMSTLTLSDQKGLVLAPSTIAPTSLTVAGGMIHTAGVVVRPNATFKGAANLTGALVNGGFVVIESGASTGTLTVQGPYTQSFTTPSGVVFSGVLALDVGGSVAGQFDRLVTSGGYQLSGLLAVSTINNFNPPHYGTGENLNLKLVDATGAPGGSTTGTFDVITLPACPPDPVTNQFRFYYITYGGGDQGTSVFLNVGNLGGNIGYGAGTNPAGTSAVPTAMALGDVSGDGLPDLVLTMPGLPGSVLVFRNLGNSGGEWQGWSAPTQYPVGNEPAGVALGNLDGVNGLDIAVTNMGNLNQTTPEGGSLSILVNNGTGTFTVRPPITTSILGTSGSAPRGIAIGQLLGGSESPPDIAIALSGNESQAIVLEVGGSFAVTPTVVPVGPRPTSASIADVSTAGTGTGLDVIFSNVGNGTASVRLNTTTEPFTTGPTFESSSISPALLSGALPTQLVAADLNEDGLPEIITVDQGSNSLSVFVNTGNDTFAPRVALPAGSPAQTPLSLTVLDMDEDGDLDLAFAAGSEDTVKVYRNDLNAGQLAFTLSDPVMTPGTVLLVGSADVTGDTRVDLVPVVNGPGDALQTYVLPNRFRSACFTANCDGSTAAPVLTANDFQCFMDAFATGNPLANCDESTGSPVLTGNDFQCFIDKFAEASVSGCP